MPYQIPLGFGNAIVLQTNLGVYDVGYLLCFGWLIMLHIINQLPCSHTSLVRNYGSCA